MIIIHQRFGKLYISTESHPKLIRMGGFKTAQDIIDYYTAFGIEPTNFRIVGRRN